MKVLANTVSQFDAGGVELVPLNGLTYRLTCIMDVKRILYHEKG